jgi:peptide deformylase
MADTLIIRLWDDPVLSQVCSKVEDNEFGSSLEAFGQQLMRTMEGTGLGLAAPQVGELKRVFVMRREETSIVAVNPVVRSYGDVVGHKEGCLSTPGIRVWIERPRQAVMQYQNPLNGETTEVDLADMEAFCAQHEEDHLLGIMIFDRRRVTRQQHRLAMREWKKL